MRSFFGGRCEPGQQGGNRGRIRGVFGEQTPQVLLLELNDGEVDEQEHRGEQRPQAGVARGHHQSRGHQQRAQVQRIARVGIRPAGGEPLVLGEAPGRPGAQGQTGQGDGEAAGQRAGAGVREPGEHDHQQKPAGNPQRGHEIGVAFGKLRHQAPHSAPRRGSRNAARRVSNTWSGVTCFMLSSMDELRL